MFDVSKIFTNACEAVERMQPCCQVEHVIVDASNLLYRIGHMERREAKRMAIMFLEKMLYLRQWYGAKAVHVVWEGRGDNWRLALLPTYKGGRDQDSELRAAVKEAEAMLRKILPLTTIESWEPIGGEGDDGFGSLARALALAGSTVGIYSTDRDLLQLASERVTLIVPQRGTSDKAMGPAEVAAKLDGLPAAKLVDVKGLQTDAGDNIPGVPGIGPKNAVALISKAGSFDALFAYVESEEPNKRDAETLSAWRTRLRERGLTPNRLELLRRHSGQARVSRSVAEIRSVELEPLQAPRGNAPELRKLLDDLGPSTYLSQNFEELAG